MKRGLLLLLLPALLAGACSGRDRDHPNIVLVSIDTLRLDALGAYGNARARTPVADRLAAAGTRFTAIRSACPLTLPSHLTMLTGLRPAEHGIRDNDPPRPLLRRAARGFPTLAERLADEGYDTAAFVSSSVLSARTGISAGFDVYDEPGEVAAGSLTFAERPGGETVRAAADYVHDASAPFFLFVHLFDPHVPYLPPIAYRSDPAPPSDSPEAYADEVAYADACLGRLLAAIEEAGHAEDTLVILTSDHGEGLGEHGELTHGYLLYDTTLRVPLIVRWPGRVAEAEERTDAASLADLFGTILAAASAPAAGHPSLLDGPIDRPVCAETLYGYRHMGWAQLLAVVKGRSKLIQGATDELYDLEADPTESAPADRAPLPLAKALTEYRNFVRRTEPGEGADLEPLAGFPYAGGVGRNRVGSFLPEEENRKLPRPDPGFARELDAWKARIGVAPAEDVKRGLAELLVRDPGNPSVAFWLGRNAVSAGDAGAAADFFGEAYRLGLADAKVLSLWLQQLLLANRLEDAGKVVRERVPEVAPDAAVWVMAGAYHQVTGDRPEAVRCLARAERLARSDRDRDLVSRFRHNLGQEKGQ